MVASFNPQNLQQRVYATLAFFDVFDYPLTLEEIKEYLWKDDGFSKEDLWKILNEDFQIQRFGNYYFLKGRRDLYKLRREYEETAEKYWKKVKWFLPFICLIPYVRMVAVCNTLAFGNPTQESDIDLLIVTKPGRIFLTRTLVTLLFSFLGVRRHGRKIAGRFCLSFFVSTEAMNMEEIRFSEHDSYLPYWLLSLKPLYGANIWGSLMTENVWVRKIFPQFPLKRKLWKEPWIFLGWAKLWEKILDGRIGNYFEKRLQDFTMKRYKHNLRHLGPESSVIVNAQMLKFHNVDRRKEINQKFERTLSSLLRESR